VIAINQDPLGAQGRRVWSSTVDTIATDSAAATATASDSKSDAIVVPCDAAAAGAHPAAADDRVLWSLEAVARRDEDTAEADTSVVIVRLNGAGAGGGLCLASNHTAVAEGGALLVETEVGDGVLFAADPFYHNPLGRPALRATAAAQGQGQEQEQEQVWPFGAVGGVRVEPCEDGKEAQRWVREGAVLKPLAAPGLCLAVASSNVDVRSMGVSVVLAPCNATYPWQQWTGPAVAAQGTGAAAAPLANGYQRQCLAPETDAPPGLQEVWAGPLADGGTAVLFFNRGNAATGLSVRWPTLGLDPHVQYEVRDLWAQAPLPKETTEVGISAWEIPPHGSAFFRVTPVV
jgi:hypothetical protein